MPVRALPQDGEADKTHPSDGESSRFGMALKESLVGTWRLVSYVEKNVDTGEMRYPMGKAPDGFIIYTADGYMSVQLEARGRQNFATSDMFGGTGEEYTSAGR